MVRARRSRITHASDNAGERVWWLAEVAHAGPEHLDASYVAAYNQKSPTYWSEDIAALQALGVDASSTVVDMGAGTGTFALAIAPHVARVVAVDVSEPMVAAMQGQVIRATKLREQSRILAQASPPVLERQPWSSFCIQ